MSKFDDVLKTLKPSDAVLAMIEGLHDASNLSYFKIDMKTFGETIASEHGMCMGCAATAAVMNLSNVNFNSSNIRNRHSAINCNISTLIYFENAIDFLRLGLVSNFIAVLSKVSCSFNKDKALLAVRDYEHEWCLLNENWKTELTEVNKFYLYLKNHGF